MSKEHPTIGVATKLEIAGSTESSEGVAFEINYGKDPYSILLSNEEMDKLLRDGLEKMLGNQALGGFDYMIELETPDLPLFVGPRSIEISPHPYLFHQPVMETAIVTMSHANEQRGILVTERGYKGAWEFLRYDVQPPLRDPEVVFAVEEPVA